jgi:translation elongation factor EF-Ts
MKAPKQTDILDHKIATLKIKRATAFTELKEQYFVVHNSITVSNIVNQGITEIYKTAINKDNLYTNIASVLGG